MGIKTSVTCPGAGCGRQVHLTACPNCRNNNWQTLMDQNGNDHVVCQSCKSEIRSVQCPNCGTTISAAKFGNWTGPCFIATELYGYNSPQVSMLQLWRDQSLMPNYFGRLFIKSYYFGSPKIVSIIQYFPTLRIYARVLVDLVIRVVSTNII